LRIFFISVIDTWAFVGMSSVSIASFVVCFVITLKAPCSISSDFFCRISALNWNQHIATHSFLLRDVEKHTSSQCHYFHTDGVNKLKS
jgi:hypothetical protein